LTFPKVKQDCLDGKFIILPSFGKVKLIGHRQIPQGFKIKTATIIQKADGWYVILSLEDSSVPVLSPDLPTMDNTIGIDMGLKAFLVDDAGEEGKGKHIGHEDLNIKGIARTRMAKSTYDAGWGTFLQILSIKAEKAGLMAIPVNPNGTTQDCPKCGQKVSKTIRDRWHSCPHCGCELDRDHNAAINIKQRAVGHPVPKARGVLSNSRTEKREARSLCEA